MPKKVAEKIDWVKLGFELFATNGVSGLIVDTMAKRLNCNRSSFYWHFKSKKEFIREIIDYWIHIDTTQIIDETNHTDNAAEQLKRLIEIVFRKDPNIDFIFYLKRYAQKEKAIQNIIDQIDQQRIAYVESLLTAMGHDEFNAKIKAGLFYKYLIGYHETIRYKPQKKNYLTPIYKELNQFIEL